MIEHAYIIPLLPLLSFVTIIFALRSKDKIASGFSIGMILISWLMSVKVLFEVIARHGESFETFYKFMDLPSFSLEVGILVDPLTAMMLVVVTTVGACVQIFSLGYMRDNPRFRLFFAYLSLSLFSMLGLVLANNFFLIFVFWELVGLTGYLLIGFRFEKKSAADACSKAFFTTRVGDMGFLIALMMLAFYAGTLNYGSVFAQVAEGAIPAGIVTAVALFIFCGAVGKSAQFPLHVWLPDATEGPTPASALIHSVTMVVAGIYLVSRTINIFVASADASMIVAIIGLVTSFMAAAIAITQNDIRRILAYSTVSQLGYMIMALGLYGYDSSSGLNSSGFYAGTFHLMTHAFFKGLLLLGAGSIIHAVHTNDIREMGGLLTKLKITAPTFMIASLSIAGIFPLSGFWSNNAIVAATASHPIFLALTLAIAFMTAFYMWRLCFMVFFGEPRDRHRFDHTHESPRVMTWPLVSLAVLSVFVGWVGIPWLSHGFASFVFHGQPYYPHASWTMMFISTIVVLGGVGLAWLIYCKKSISADNLAVKFSLPHRLSLNKFYFDELYQMTIINPVMVLARFTSSFDVRIVDGLVNGIARVTLLWSDLKQWIDSSIVDGTVNGSGWLIRKVGDILRYLQNGRVQFYTMSILSMVILFGLWKFEFSFISDDWPTMTIIFILGVSLLVALNRLTLQRQQSDRKIKQEMKPEA